MQLTPGLLYKKELKIGIDELQWLQAEGDEQAAFARRANMTSHGLVLARLPSGDLDDVWRVTDDNDDGTITVKIAAVAGKPTVAIAVTDTGLLFGAHEEINLTLPDDNTWYTIVAEIEDQEYEKGTLTLTAGLAAIVGTGTAFTRLSGLTTDGYGRGTRIRIDAADSAAGNAGTFELDTVADDTNATLTAAIPGGNEAGVRFTVAGDYAVTTPADPDIHRFRRAKITRIALTREPPANQIPLADVKRNDAGAPNVTIIDRRLQRQYRQCLRSSEGCARSVNLTPALYVDVTGAAPYAPAMVITGALTAVQGRGAGCAPANERGLLTVWDDGGNLKALHIDDTAIGFPGWTGPLGAAIVAGSQPTLVQLPAGSGYTHALMYIAANVLYVRHTTDNGATWTAAAVALDPTLNDPLDTCANPHVIRLLNGRLLCAVEYYDNSAARRYVVGVASDDHGVVWDTNGGVGYLIKGITMPATDVRNPWLAQAPTGRIWCVYEEDVDDVGGNYTDDPSGISWGIQPLPSVLLSRYGAISSLVDPCAWVSPEGQLVVLYGAHTIGTTSMKIRYAVCGYAEDGTKHLVADYNLLTVDAGMAVKQAMALSLTQERNGRIAFTWLDTNSATDNGFMCELVPQMVAVTDANVCHDG